MQKRLNFTPTLILTFAACAIRIYTNIYFVSPATGKFSSPVWEVVSIVIMVLCALSGLLCFHNKLVDYKTNLKKSTGTTTFFILSAFASSISAVGAALDYIRTSNKMELIVTVTAIICTVFFIYLAVDAEKVKQNTLLILTVGPFSYLMFRIIRIFNVYSRNISLYTFRYEIIGICCLLLFIVMYIKSSVNNTTAKSAAFFGITAFSFLMIYSLPSLLTPLFSSHYFTENAPLYYVCGDIIFSVCSLYFANSIIQQSNTKH